MQVRYVFDPDLSQAGGRLARRLIPVLAERLALKAEALGGSLPPAWKDFYELASKPLLNPQVQLFQGPTDQFRPQALLWNVLIEPDRLPAGADEIWVFSAEAAQRLNASNPAELPIKVLPLAAGNLEPAGPLPLELGPGQLLFCSQPSLASLEAVLRAYLPLCADRAELTLVLHLAETEDVEAQLLQLLDQLAAASGISLDVINLETWIGPLEAGAYTALLERAAALLAPAGPMQALEALKLGKPVLGLEYSLLGLSAELTPARLLTALDASPASLARPEPDLLLDLAEAIQHEVERIEREVDFDARAARWRQASERADSGRKQKYSLFHSDYQEPEMQARRQWHLRYAKLFSGVPGDVLDIGCGSGIFLELMRELGMPACGVDPDPDMVEVCKGLGLQALAGDERLLSQWQSESLGGIHASHVIEHVDGSRAIALIENAFRALRPGGKLIVRTPNWRSAEVRHEGFWLDITHIRPYPLPLLQQVFSDAGFEIDQHGFEEFGWKDTYLVGRKPDVSELGSTGGNHGE
ncbi:MAG: hypothetical protein CVV27_00960 [Candidatus Melainabacteria bacterium HGW-Melainabacteria-1]|nr:MAG: hypothetical protein CVV27_00960 [Candidatus Melainabacteria bacterium HGW-Melainabacteria-1]